MESGSPKAVAASGNDTPCFCSFDAALSGSQSNLSKRRVSGQGKACGRTAPPNGPGILLARAISSQGAGYSPTHLEHLRVQKGAKSTAVCEAVWSETYPPGNPRSSNSLLECSFPA